MSQDVNSKTDDLIKWAEEVANKANCSSTRVLALFCIENKKQNASEERSKVIVAQNLINGR